MDGPCKGIVVFRRIDFSDLFFAAFALDLLVVLFQLLVLAFAFAAFAI